ncbi:hypothetical protein [Rhodococcus sp. UNC23MFCrub1.1]|uniref:hypothetical protein n=1 Tax=Rhodococcus sp. UNC23MFCrub1.1 TaxID=1449068 RepID=UPI000480B696|nr:hypothetical protein [Rhodococcus sp. UNC23MFCrub1.1]
MRTRLGALDRRTRTALGGPGLGVVALAALVVLGAVILVHAVDPDGWVVAVVLALVALVVNLGGARRSRRR